MAKSKKAKLSNSLHNLLQKNERKKIQEIKAKKYQENMERAKKNRTTPKSSTVLPKRLRPQYSSKDKILLVGEGNFSFARSLCENYLEEGADNLTATCFDSEDVLYEKYEEAKENIELVRSFGGTVLFGVDATNPPKEIRKNKYTKIVFNFPHVGAGIKDQDRNVIANQKLLNGFFDAVEPLLTKASDEKVGNDQDVIEDVPEGEIHVTLKTCKPYNLWAIKSLVKAKGVLAVRGTAPFYVDDFPGYEHRRTLGFKEGLSKAGNAEILASEPKRYIFVRKEVMEEENEKSIKGSQKRKLEILKAQMGKKVKRKKTETSMSDNDDD
ncbi:uncharacterized protein BX663DRAFT_490565 [Cokeromyces recurvatus]|uniref:uncharacterized protein n=1 Tax=Cokeromyces recurvatus TaxID=90255 RepID=UPI0022206529|nr:uncharacterized protein BX663DRAFT_490565 [Cokeromyces recurvatus]KAI7897839.1 hypothetical protein BX663DRAFT_490565 [Cokeromyces recurvatus]